MFELSGELIKGSFDLELTIKSGQTSEPEMLELEPASFLDLSRPGGVPVKCKLRQLGDPRNASLLVDGVAARGERLPEDEIRRGFSLLFRLEDDLAKISTDLQKVGNGLGEIIERFRGLRLIQSRDPFVGLICAIWSQNNSVHLWNRSVRIMIAEFGQRTEFADGSKHRLFPLAKKLAKMNTQHFKKITRCGYRAKYILQTARLVRAGDLDLDDMARWSYPQAREALMEMLGIGPKVADCFLLYGVGKTEAAPVDVWIHRVASKLFFGNERVSRERVATLLRAKYGRLAGYAQLYLFCLARETMLKRARELIVS